MLMAQPYRAFAKDLLEKQVYPVRGPRPVRSERPYDVTGWTLPYQMGVETVEIAKVFEAKLERLDTIPVPPGRWAAAKSAVGYEISHDTNNASIVTNRLLKAGYEPGWTPEGAIYVPNKGAVGADLEAW